MSASRDKSQKFTFVYSNLYQIYKKGKEAAQSAAVPEPSVVGPAVVTARVLKADNLHAATPNVADFRPAEFIAKRISIVPKPAVLQETKNESLEGLKDNLKSLQDLHSRLRVMLKELEDLVKE